MHKNGKTIFAAFPDITTNAQCVSYGTYMTIQCSASSSYALIFYENGLFYFIID